MEIKKSVIVVKCDSEEKDILEKAFRIVAEIHQNKDIQSSCETDCPFKKRCNMANDECPHDCLLDTTLFNLKEILQNV